MIILTKKKLLKKINNILENKFGVGNKNQYQYILDKNKNYGYKYFDNNNYLRQKEGTGIIFMPLEYYKEWSSGTSVCNPHYGCFSYTLDIKGQLENLYIFKIKLKEKQLFTCQVCFQSFRAHRDKIDKINKIFISRETNNQIKDELLDYSFLLNYNFCGIKIIKNDNDFNVMKNYYSYRNDYDFSSIKEASSSLDPGEFLIMVYPESSINEGVIRFLSEKRIEIDLLSKKNIKNNNNITYNTEEIFNNIFDYEYSYYKQFNYKDFLKNLSPKNKINVKFDKEIFLPGIKEYYTHFKTLAESKGLKADEAIYSISKDGDAYFYDIIDSKALNKIYGERKKNGEIKVDQISIESLQFWDSLGFPYKVNNEKDLIHEIKINKEPISCLMSQYDEKTGVLTSGTTYLTRYYNKAKEEDILLVETDKSGDFKKRQYTPLFVIILDISGSMHEYTEILQNKIIPRLLRKLGYYWEELESYYKLIKEKNITNFEILQAISSKYKLENFLSYYNLKYSIAPEDLKLFSNNIIPLITFSTNSKFYFYDVLQFENNKLCGGTTYFEEAAINLKLLLDSVSRERSIRLLSFSDGEISDSSKAMKILDKILNSGKTRHQMNSVSVRICHGTQPDTKILMKLSAFSHPICDMTQLVINPREDKDINKVVDRLYDLFVNDDMIYNLKLISDICFMSNDFSSFDKEQFYNNKNSCIRLDRHLKNLNDYKKSIKSPSCNLIFEEGGELNENQFYNIMGNKVPYIAQRLLERIANNNNTEENKEIINYFKVTENYFEKKNISNNNNSSESNKVRIFKILEDINNKKDISQMNFNKLNEYISEVSDKAKEIITIKNDLKKNNNDELIRIINDLKTDITGKTNEIRKIQKDNIDKDKQLNNIKKENEKLNDNYKILYKEYQKLKQENENINIKIINITSTKESEFNKLKEDYNKLQKDYETLVNAYKQLKFDNDKFKQKQDTTEKEAEKKIEKLNNEINCLKTQNEKLKESYIKFIELQKEKEKEEYEEAKNTIIEEKGSNKQIEKEYNKYKWEKDELNINSINNINNDDTIEKGKINSINQNESLINDQRNEAFSDFQETLEFQKLEENQFTFRDDLHTTVSDPIKINPGFFSRSYFQYTIKIFPLKHSVSRKVSDFTFLDQKLPLINPIKYIPSLPNFTFGLKDDSPKKMRYIQNYLNLLIENKYIRTLEIVYDFLTLPQEEWNNKMKSKYNIIKKENEFKQIPIFEGKYSVNLTEDEEMKASKIKNEINLKNASLVNLNSHLDKLLNDMEKISISMNNVGLSFRQLYKNYGKNKVLEEGISNLSDLFEIWGNDYKTQKEYFRDEIKYYFKFINKEYNTFLKKYDNLIKKRENYKKEYENIKKKNNNKNDLLSLKANYAFYLNSINDDYSSLEDRLGKRLIKQFLKHYKNKDTIFHDYQKCFRLLKFHEYNQINNNKFNLEKNAHQIKEENNHENIINYEG